MTAGPNPPPDQVGTLLKLLRSTTHHGFPVTAIGGGGGVLGVILRDQLMTILSKRRFESRRASSPHLGSYFQQHAGPASQQPPLTADDFLRPWKAISLDQLALTLSPEDLARVVNLRPYLNEAALVYACGGGRPNSGLARAAPFAFGRPCARASLPACARRRVRPPSRAPAVACARHRMRPPLRAPAVACGPPPA